VFPAAVASLFAGRTIDGVACWLDASVSVVAASNVDRVTVQ
jgi:hypothetical protein